MSGVTDLSIILVSYNTAKLLADSLKCLHDFSSPLKCEIIIVDNASKDASVEFIKTHYPKWRLIENNVNVGFGRANNQALPFVSGRYVLLLNTDAFIAADTLGKTLAYMDAHPKCGILGVKLVGRDGVLQPSARFFPTPWNIFLQRTGLDRLFRNARMMDDMDWDHASIRKCDWVPGCYYLVRKEVIDQVGLFDPRYFLYYEEVDHCFTTKKAGWEVVFYPDTTVIHIGGESAKSEGSVTRSGSQIETLKIESELLYFRKNHGFCSALTDVLLISLADGMDVLKRLLKLKRPLGLNEAWQHSALVWSSFQRTRWGARPTR